MVEVEKEAVHEAQLGASWRSVANDVVNDLRFGIRLLIKDRQLTVASVITLGLGIASATTVFAIVNAVALSGLPGTDASRIVHIGTQDRQRQDESTPYLDYEEWRRSTKSFSSFGAFAEVAMNVTEPGLSPERLSGTYLSAEVFDLLGVEARSGRRTTSADDNLGVPAVAVLSHELWMRRYGTRPDAIGRQVKINGAVATIIGVMPEGFKFPNNSEIWQPISAMPDLVAHPRGQRLDIVGRLGDGVSIDGAKDELQAIATRVAAVYSGTDKDPKVTVKPFTQRYIGAPVRIILFTLLGAVGLLLLIACGNVAILMLSRTGRRIGEMSIRSVMGASKGRLVRQVLTESALLALVAGIVSIAFAIIGIRIFDATVNEIGKPYWMKFTMDASVWAFMAATCLGTSVLFGTIPAFQLSQSKLGEVLKEHGSARSVGRRRRIWSSGLVAAEVALTMILLTLAALMVRNFVGLQRSDKVVETSNLAVSEILLPPAQFPTPEQRLTFYNRLDDRLKRTPQLSSATIANFAPFSGSLTRQLHLYDRPAPADTAPNVSVVVVGDRYFETLKLPILIGRAFAADDGMVGREVAIVNQRFTTTYLRSTNPIGQRIRLVNRNSKDEVAPWLTVVGVSPTVRQRSEGAGAVVYIPLNASPPRMASLIVRPRGDGAGVAELVRDELNAVDPDLPLFGISSMEQVLARSQFVQRVFGSLFTIFGAMGLLLSAAGLYAVTSASVASRFHEFMVRVAVGAYSSNICWLVLRTTISRLIIGIVVGTAGAIAAGAALRSLLQIDGGDSIMFVGIWLLIAAVSIIASLVAARQITRVHPTTALRGL